MRFLVVTTSAAPSPTRVPAPIAQTRAFQVVRFSGIFNSTCASPSLSVARQPTQSAVSANSVRTVGSTIGPFTAGSLLILLLLVQARLRGHLAPAFTGGSQILHRHRRRHGRAALGHAEPVQRASAASGSHQFGSLFNGMALA